MKTFKEQLRRAQERHNETVTDFVVACHLWPKSPDTSKRVLLSIALNQGLTLTVDHLQKLMSLFPDTPVSEWVNVKCKNDE